MRVAVVGAGVAGRLCALAFMARGHAVVVYDHGPARASGVAAGLLSPLSGRELPDASIVALASRSLSLWRELAPALQVPFAAEGTIIVAHPRDRLLLDELERGLRSRMPVEPCDAGALESSLARLGRALSLPEEGWIDAPAALRAIAAHLRQGGATLREGVRVVPCAYAVDTAEGRDAYDCVIDCRGLGARDDLPRLRGVRGELLLVEAPEVELRRPVRVLHARAPLYVVPRGDRRCVIGATLVESEDRGPISVRAALELLSMAYALEPGFAEARILETATGLRPALPDHLPLVDAQPGLVRVNGLYRHGFVIGPALAERVCALVEAHGEEAARCVSA
jgi:glycine oxidase